MRISYLKAGFLLAAVYIGLGLVREPATGFTHGVHLVFHEAGHVIFMIFGSRFLTILGGTLGQLLMPLAVILSFIKTRQNYSACVTGVWLAASLADVAPYAKDARAMDLVLLGGVTGLESGGHDWNNMLFELDWLHHDQLIGNLFIAAGYVTLLLSLGAGLYFSRKDPDEF